MIDPRSYGRTGKEERLKGPMFGSIALLLFLIAWFTLGYGMTWWESAPEIAIPSLIGFAGLTGSLALAIVLGGLRVQLTLFNMVVVFAGLAGMAAALLAQLLLGFAFPPQAALSLSALPLPFLMLWFASFGIAEEFQWGGLIYNVALDAWARDIVGEILIMVLTVVAFSIFHTAVIFVATGGLLFGAYGLNYYVITAVGRFIFNVLLRMPPPVNNIAVPAIAHGGLNAVVIFYAACVAGSGGVCVV